MVTKPCQTHIYIYIYICMHNVRVRLRFRIRAEKFFHCQLLGGSKPWVTPAYTHIGVWFSMYVCAVCYIRVCCWAGVSRESSLHTHILVCDSLYMYVLYVIYVYTCVKHVVEFQAISYPCIHTYTYWCAILYVCMCCMWYMFIRVLKMLSNSKPESSLHTYILCAILYEWYAFMCMCWLWSLNECMYRKICHIVLHGADDKHVYTHNCICIYSIYTCHKNRVGTTHAIYTYVDIHA